MLAKLCDLDLLGLLRGVWVIGAGVDLQLPIHRVAHLGLRQHPADRFLDEANRAPFTQVDRALFAEPALEPAVATIDFLGFLPARQLDRIGVDDDDVIAGVDVRCVDRPVLALEQASGHRRDAAENLASCVYDVPPAVRAFRAGYIRAHEIGDPSLAPRLPQTGTRGWPARLDWSRQRERHQQR